MMEIGVLGDPRAAQALADYMASRGISAQLGPAHDGVSVQVEPEHYQQGREEFERFLAEPYHQRYMEASWHSGNDNHRLQYGDSSGSLLHSLTSRAGPLTLGIMVLVSAIWGLFLIGLAPEVFEWARFFASWEEMEQGQWWRFFTPSLIHFTVTHFLFNTLWWWYIGGPIERHRGVGTLLILLIVGGTLPNLAQFALVGPSFGGLSGVVYALLGYSFINSRNNPNSVIALPSPLIGFMLVWLVIGFTGFMNMANAAHLGGLLVGMVQGFIDRRKS